MDALAYETLEQMRIYMKLNEKTTEEFRQVEVIFNAFIAAIGNSSFKNLLKTFLETNRKISGLHPKSLVYWRSYVKYMDARMKAPPPGSLIRFSGLPEELEQTPSATGPHLTPSELQTAKYF